MLKNTKLNKTNRHCECNEAISSRLLRQFFPRNDRGVELPRATALAMTNESGRSMVEMLGVLALIGVLSVAGVAGYTTAMNKYKANEILNGASQRALSVSSQIQRGETNPSLGEFSDETVAGVGYTVSYTSGGTTFTLTLSSVPKEVCAQMKNNTGNNVNIGDCPTTATGNVVLTYNNDLSAPVSTASGEEQEEENCAERRKYTFRNVEMCCPHDLNGDGSCANDEDGCEEGLELGTDGQTCCDIDGYYIDENNEDIRIYDFSICGCPDDTYYYDGDCHTCKKGECSEDSATFVAGAIGTWDDLNDNAGSITNNGCPTGYTWASMEQTQTNLSAILDGSKCATCKEKYLWTSTELDSDFAVFVQYTYERLNAADRYAPTQALCVR